MTAQTCPGEKSFLLWRIVALVALCAPTIVFSILFPQHVIRFLRFEVFLLLTIIVLLSPLLPLAVVALQLALPFKQDKWELPTHHSNPLHTGSPLLFIHFFAHFAMAQGGACLLSAVWIGVRMAVVGVGDILIGLGVLLGLRWSMRLADSKVTATELKQ